MLLGSLCSFLSSSTIVQDIQSIMLLQVTFDFTKPQFHEELDNGTYAEILHDFMSEIWDLARIHISQGKHKQKKYYNRDTRPTNLKVGDAVLYYTRRGYKHITSKLLHRGQVFILSSGFLIQKLTFNFTAC